ncbi:protein spire isoform X1 [Neodiprion virginianus]|uniref:protein spire isoform X1 n=1 Tax=Neodiprion virginianus TaxID=2961670 RepID=UPI001EE73739|nr:protein spire isoform X1 [Neodiprion virginianus]
MALDVTAIAEYNDDEKSKEAFVETATGDNSETSSAHVGPVSSCRAARNIAADNDNSAKRGVRWCAVRSAGASFSDDNNNEQNNNDENENDNDDNNNVDDNARRGVNDGDRPTFGARGEFESEFDQSEQLSFKALGRSHSASGDKNNYSNNNRSAERVHVNERGRCAGEEINGSIESVSGSRSIGLSGRTATTGELGMIAESPISNSGGNSGKNANWRNSERLAEVAMTAAAGGDEEESALARIVSRNERDHRATRSCENTPVTASCCPTIVRSGKKLHQPPRPRCRLNADNCLSLRDILLSFNGPISEEQAWALCYQCARCFKNAIFSHPHPSPRNDDRLYHVTELSHVLLHRDGDVHQSTMRNPPNTADTDSREAFTSEHKLVFSLGMIVFAALDFGLDEEEERRVAPDLEALITLMTQPEDESEAEDRLQETDDEGIERDSGESEDDPIHQTPDAHGVHPAGYIRRVCTPRAPAPCSINTVIQLCTRHLQGTSEQADTHYKAVVRALVAEALELSHFLEKVAADKQGNNSTSTVTGDTTERNLDTLDFNDWTNVRIWRALQARFWVQVIGELRRGVKLKKVEGSIGPGGEGGTGGGHPGGKRTRVTGRGIEFELTPYEILMDDIRARRYRLRTTPSPSPAHLRKDAHAVILDFIRSRPPLKKASERKLPPLKRQSTPHELLMESIKRPPKPLRPSCSPKRLGRDDATEQRTPTRDFVLSGTGTKDDVETTNAGLDTTPKSSRRASNDLSRPPHHPPRRLIIPDDVKLDGEDDDDDDCWGDGNEIEDDNDEAEVEGERQRAGESANPWRRTGGLRLTRNEYHRFCDTQLESYDLATQCPTRRISNRRHTVTSVTSTGLGTLSLPHSRPQSRLYESRNLRDTTLPRAPRSKDRDRFIEPELPSSVSSSQDELGQEVSMLKSSSKGGGNSSLGNMFLDERLSLTLEEIVHIRSVLTKAELESLPVEGRVKEDVEKRRVCFLCLKTRFGILGPWGQRCRLCERTVCGKCYIKMRIPTEHFAHVPVVLLSPSLMLSPASEVDGKEYSSPSHGAVRNLWPRPAGGVGSAPASPATKRRDPALRNTPTPTPTPSSVNISHREDDGTACNSLPPSNSSPAASFQKMDKSRRFYCSSANSSPARTSASSARYGAGDLRVAEQLRGVAMVVCQDCRILVLQIIQSSRTTRATIRNNVISRLTLNLSPIYV